MLLRAKGKLNAVARYRYTMMYVLYVHQCSTAVAWSATRGENCHDGRDAGLRKTVA